MIVTCFSEFPYLVVVPVGKQMFLIIALDEKSDLHYICNPVLKCKCREGNKFAIVQIHAQIFEVMSVKRYLLTNTLIFHYT